MVRRLKKLRYRIHRSFGVLLEAHSDRVWGTKTVSYYLWLQLGLLICKLCEIANSPS